MALEMKIVGRDDPPLLCTGDPVVAGIAALLHPETCRQQASQHDERGDGQVHAQVVVAEHGPVRVLTWVALMPRNARIRLAGIATAETNPTATA